MPKSRLHRRSAFAVAIFCGLFVLAIPVLSAAAEPDSPKAEPLLSVASDAMHLGYTYVGDGGTRYFVADVKVTNSTDELLTVPIARFELWADGVLHAPDVEHPKLTGYQFAVGGKLHHFRDLGPMEELTVPPGESASTWITFTELPKSADVPRLELRLELNDQLHRVDLTGISDAALKLHVERIGPRQALGLVTIDGRLNTISVGTLVKTLDQLAAAGVGRIVLSFGSQASELDEPMGDWLRQIAEDIPASQAYAIFPAVVSTIREFHVAAIPGSRNDVSAVHVHGTAASAVEQALASAYANLTPDEIVAQIEEGHPLAQASALVSGGGLLPSVYLPLLLERAESDDRLLRRGALIALSGSGDPQAIRVLSEQARSRDAHFAQLAIECLAASRYSDAHAALAGLLKERLGVDEAIIVQVLAKYPRPQWADYLATLALAKERSVAAAVRREVIMALGRIGHPQLTEILSDALASYDEGLRQTAFQLLLTRDDAVSERLAMDFALQQLAQGPPTPGMMQLFDRVRDPRVAPLLMSFLDDEKYERSALINTLARIGPSDIERELANRFEKFKPNEQATVLNNLTQMRSQRLPALAEQGLASQHDVVFNSAVRSLSLQSDATAVELLAARLGEEKEINRIGNLAKALEDIGLPQAGRALELARNSSSGDKRKAIANRLQALNLKSPGGQYLQRAERYVQEENQEKAIEFYTLALKRDPDLGAAHSGRGHAELKLEQLAEAEQDFRRALELDPDDGMAVTGLGITLAINGKVDEAVATVEDASERFSEDLLFAYNAACVYGRALEHLPNDPESPEQIERRKQLESAAVSRLQASVEMGFTDLDWMQKDPDLASLQELETFRAIVSGADEEDESEPHSHRKDAPRTDVPRRTFSKPEPGEQ